MQFWRNLKIGSKLALFSTISLIAILGVGLYSTHWLSRLSNEMTESIESRKFISLFAQKEIDHLKWINKVQALWNDPTIAQIKVHTDDKTCSLGKWLYGGGAKKIDQTLARPGNNPERPRRAPRADA